MQALAGGAVEVVGRLVEQQHVGSCEQQSGQREPDRLAAGDLADVSVQQGPRQAEPLELGAGALVDVPVGADGVEVRLVDRALLDAAKRPTGRTEAEEVLDGLRDVEDEVLREQADAAPHGEVARGGCDPPGEQVEQGGLPGPVGPDEAGTARRDDGVEVTQRDGAVGSDEAQALDGQGGAGQGSGHVAPGGGHVGVPVARGRPGWAAYSHEQRRLLPGGGGASPR